MGSKGLANLWSFILSLLYLGALASLFLLPPIANGLGRKRGDRRDFGPLIRERGWAWVGLYLTEVGFLVSAVPAVLAQPTGLFELLCLGRFLNGACCGSPLGLFSFSDRRPFGISGVSSGLVAMYLVEISPSKCRGFMRFPSPASLWTLHWAR